MAGETYYFLSAFEEGLEYQGAKPIALTPEVCARLTRAQVPYQVFDETPIERELKKDARSYFFEQLERFRDFDRFLNEHIEYCRLKDASLATAHYTNLKYFIDSAISYAYALRCFIQRHTPAKIVHITAAAGENTDPSIYVIFHSPTTIIAQLLPHVCGSLGVDYEQRILMAGKQKQDRLSLGLLKGIIKNMLLTLGFKSLLNFIRFKKYRCLIRRTKPMQGLGILFLHTGCFSVDYAAEQSLFAGARVFTMGKNTIEEENSIIQRRQATLHKGQHSAFTAAVREECYSAARIYQSQGGLFSWVRQKAGVAIDDFLTPYLNYFISHICYDTILKTEKLIAFYDRNKIDMVVMRASTGYDSAFTLTAAKMRPHIKRVCIQHSSTALDGLLLPMTELGFFDYYLATEGYSEQYFNAYRKYDIFKHCRVKQAAHYLKSIQARYSKKPPQRGRERILFAPADVGLGRHNFNNQAYWDSVWYFAFLGRLLAYFAQREDKLFIFKYRFGSRLMSRAVIPYIVSQDYTNIILESRPLVDCFHLAQRVILDYPSSGLFESVAAGMPTLALYKRTFITWPEAVKFFGCSLRPFDDAREAEEEINRFLDDDPSNYVRRLPLSDDSIVEVLSSIAGPLSGAPKAGEAAIPTPPEEGVMSR